MLQNLKDAIKLRAFLVFLLVHLGLGCGVFALARSSYEAWSITSTLFLISIILLYGGFLLGVLFILLPALPWIRRIQRVEHWTERLIHELPLILAQIPKIIAAAQAIIAVWNEAKKSAENPSSPPSQK